MKGQPNVATPQEYLAKLTEPRRTEIAQLDALIRKTAPQLAPGIHSGMLSYGPYHYKYASGREGDWFRIGLASNANYISLYAMAADANGYVAERYRSRLPKASIGKSCVRFKRVADLDLEALAELIRVSASTGFTEVLADSGESAAKKGPAAKAVRGTAKKSAVAKAARGTAKKSAAAKAVRGTAKKSAAAKAVRGTAKKSAAAKGVRAAANKSAAAKGDRAAAKKGPAAKGIRAATKKRPTAKNARGTAK